MKHKVLATLIFFPALLAAQQAPKDTARLADLVITATRLPMPRASLASSVTVLMGDALRAQGIQTVAEALRTVPGAALAQNGSFGAATSLFLRGGESDYVQVLVDGVSLNGPGGTFNYAALTTDNVERIEVVAGPTSVLYGSDAVAGVVQIFTRQGRGPQTVEAGVRAGTYNTLVLDGGVRGGSDQLDYSFSLSRFTTDGSYAYNNSHRNLVASSRFRVKPDTRSDITLTLRYGDNTFHYPTDFAGRLTDRNQFTYASSTALGLDAGRRFSNRVEARLLIASHQGDDGAEDQADTPADTLGFYASSSLNHGRRRSADVRANIFLGKPGILTIGAKLESQAQRGVSETRSQFGVFGSSNDFGRYNRAGYAQALLEPASRVSLTLGGRVDDNDKFGIHGTYRLGFSVRPVGGTRVRGTVGTGFKEATFFENSRTPISGGNPNLNPERSLSWEVGAEQVVGGRVFLDATYFSQRFRDMIQYNPAPLPGVSNYQNIAAANANGVETGARVVLPAGLGLRATYTYVRTRSTDAGFDSGFDATFVKDSALLRRPAHSLAVTASFEHRRGAANASVRYVGARVDRDFAAFPSPRVMLPAYTVVALAGDVILHQAEPHLAATFRVENALDRQYAEILNYPARGRTVLVGGRVVF